ncbi:MAG: hypothetical protein ACUZ77_09125 [Candidatus Brocadiales bacterium]
MPEKIYTGLEERTAKIEGLLEQMDKRLDRVEVGIVDLKNEIKSDMGRLETNLRADMEKLETGLRAAMERLETNLRAEISKLDGRFMWLIGIIIGTWVTAILTIIFKG